MKKLLLISIFVLGMGSFIFGQTNKYSTLYYQRASLFEELPVKKSDIIFLGNSITHFGEWREIFDNKHVKNRGISGDIVQGVYDRLDPILKGQPKKIFLLIGINDVSHNVTADSIVRGIAKIAAKIAADSPKTKLYIQSIFPVNESLKMFLGATKKGDVVIEINNGLRRLCQDRGLIFIDVYSALKSIDSEALDTRYTNDGLHLMGEGYLVWKSVVSKYL
ncbi:MAG: Sialate-O-acetyltransferase [uncultured bacterium]|nr:MAG: Sialate-O-acetyltransferase [uncultured bacterium]HBY01550.1 sialate O-acetylesterase [Rikenellaceae bacterium]